MRGAMPEFDLYVIDHRGVGYSSPLTCPDQESADSEGGGYIDLDEWPACITWLNENLGDALHAYSTRNAAHDLAGFIDATREPGKPVFVWGASYGTYLAERYMLLHPDQADGVIVDSIHALSVPALAFYPYYDNNGQRLLQRCADDSFCSGKLGNDPWGKLDALYQKLENGHCPTLGIDKYTTAYLLGWLAWYSPYNAAAPAFIYRLDRCDPADVNAIVYMFYYPFNGTGDLLDITSGWFSQVLNANVGMSDQYWGPQFDGVDINQYITDLNNNMLFGTMPTPDEYALYQQWPKYDEPQARELPKTSIPVLMMQGTLDGATPYEVSEPLGEALHGPHQYYLTFPNSAHGVIDDSWVSLDYNVPTCGLDILAQFVRDPLTEPDTSCIAQTLPVDFAGSTELAQYLFATYDLWENPPARSAAPPVRPVRIDQRVAPWLYMRP
jgi:pimeloyl-ACP methyl ester carboxylesterase